MKKEQIINNYLYFGYLPPKSIPAWLNSAFKPSDAFDYSIEGANALFDKVFDELVAQHTDSRHLIPLSGGWDSRAILGALFERVDRSNIETVTFGVPGQLDYDVGIKIAKWAGIQLHALDLRQIEFTWDQLLKSVEKSPWTYVPDAYFNHFARSVETNVETIWTGFLGDPLTGSHLMDYSTSLYCQKSIREGQKKIQDIYLPNKLNEPIYNYKIDNVNIRIDDYLDLGVRQSYCIAPITLPVSNLSILQTHFEEEDRTVVAPFTQFDFVNYWLKAPVELRKNQQLYLQMLNFKFPELFALPSKYSLGLKNNLLKKSVITIINRIKHHLYLSGLKKSKHVFAVSNPIVELLTKKGVHNISQIPHALNLNKFYNPEIVDFHLKLHQLKEQENFIITYTGWVTENRGFQLMMDTIKITTEKDDKIILVIAGADSKFSVKIQNFAKINQLEKNIVNFGIIDMALIPGILKFSDVCLSFLDPDVPAYKISPPQKVIEYFAAGKPVICNQIETHNWIVENGKTGFITQMNADEVSNAVIRLKEDTDLYQQMCVNASLESNKYAIEKVYGNMVETMIKQYD